MRPVRMLTAVLSFALAFSSCVNSPFPGSETDHFASASASPPLQTVTASVLPITTPSRTAERGPIQALPQCSSPGTVGASRLQLAFTAEWDGDGEVYSVRGDGSDLSQLTNNPTEDAYPAWSPDGQQIALVLDIWNPTLYVVQADGMRGTIVSPDFEVNSRVEWSPQGDLVAFRNVDDLYLMSTSTGELSLLTGAIDTVPRQPMFSPDGTAVAFAADVRGGGPGDALFVVNADGTGLRQVGNPHEVIYSYMWHPEGDQILFDAWSPTEAGIYVARLDGTVAMLPVGPYSGSPVWSPEGSMISYLTGEARLDPEGNLISRDSLHIATLDGEVDVAVIEPPPDPDTALMISGSSWAPDGRHLAYSVGARGSELVDVFVLDICDGTSSLVAEAIDAFSPLAWRPLP